VQPIYLDFNATTPVDSEAVEAMLPFLGEHFGNPSSAHAPGRICHEAVEDARGRVAALVGADREEIVFPSGGTESNNLAIRGIVEQPGNSPAGHLVISTIEHPAVEQPAAYLERVGYEVTRVGCDEHGVVDPDDVRRALRRQTRLVSIMHANNEIGSIQPIRAIADICHERGVLLHTDAAQSAGKIRTQAMELDADMISIAGHKLYAPKGVGALYVRRELSLQPILYGAGHESGLRPGTENVASIVALCVASVRALQSLDAMAEQMAEGRDHLESRLQEEIGNRLTIHGLGTPRLPNTLSVNFPDVIGADLLSRTPELYASTGSACHDDDTAMSATLKEIGRDAASARGTIRLSLGRHTTLSEVDRAADLLLGAWESLVD